MKMKYIKSASLALVLTLIIDLANAQQRPQVEPEKLGSSARVVSLFNRDPAVAARGALPSYDDMALGSLIEMVSKKYANGDDPLQINLDAIESLFQIKATGEGEVQQREYAYQISKKTGRLYLFRDRSALKPYSLSVGARELRIATQTHPEILKLFGIDKSRLSFLNSNLILVEGVEKLATGGFGKPTSRLVDNIYSYGQRSIEGILTDGSYVKVFSKNARTNEGLIVNWPRFQLHPGLQKFELKSKTDILNEAIEHVKRVANPKHEVNVKMAVVFRPVMSGETKVFIPAMKVGLYSRPIGDAFADDKGENGDLFFIDLMKQSLQYSDPEDRDGDLGGNKG